MRRREWYTTQHNQRGLLFAGSRDLIGLLDRLLRRPWRFAAERLLPIIYLVIDSPAPHTAPLPGIADRLDQAQGRKIVYARVPAMVAGPGLLPEVRRVLDCAVAGLAGRFGTARPVRFPHYAVATWLLGLHQNGLADVEHPDQADAQIAQELRAFVERRHAILTRADTEIQELAADLPWFVRGITRLVPRLGLVFLRAWRAPRWFAAHPLGRACGRSFIRLARVVAGGDTALVTDEALSQLLVDAVLRDLRRAYRRTSLFGTGRRRTGYPVLLLDDARVGSPGFHLLRLVNTSRNTAAQRRLRRPTPYRWDPLLVVAVGDSAGQAQLTSGTRGTAQRAGEATEEILPPADAAYAYRSWEAELEHAGRYRSWLLPLRVPDGPAPSSGYGELLHVGVPRVRRAAMSFVAVLLLVASSAVAITSTYNGCGAMPWQPKLSRESLSGNRTQCVGLSDGAHRFFDAALPPNARRGLAEDLKNVENKILKNNKNVVSEKDQKNYVTLIYLTILSDAVLDSYEAALEELRGVAIAQEQSPIRVLLANAGQDMKSGKVAAEAIVAEARRDRTIKAVLGLGQSRDGTKEAIRELGTAGIPMMGTLLSATELTNLTRYYHQVSPTNQRQAAVAAAHAKNLGVTRVKIYYAGDDMYSKDLRSQAKTAFEQKGIGVEHEESMDTPGGRRPDQLGRDACNLPAGTLAFFTGRTEAFSQFLTSMDSACDEHPPLLAGDDVSRFVLTNGMQKRNVTLDYISLGSSLAWGECENLKQNIFFGLYQDLFGSASMCTRTRDGRAMLAYDAVETVRLAVQSARDPLKPEFSRDDVGAALNDISIDSPYLGAAGMVHFMENGKRSPVPLNKAIVVLRVSGFDGPTVKLLCGNLSKTVTGDPGCPIDRASGP